MTRPLRQAPAPRCAALLVCLLWVHGCASEEKATAPTVIFVVLDTVRADHLSLCGYERPTSPQLERLAARPGAFASCRAYAPGDWTLPSHASFFTGIDASRHGARIASEGPVLAHVNVSPLPDAYSTLAEQLSEEGYQTVAISGNPVLSQDSGLMQGFDAWYAPETFGELGGRPLVRVVQETLSNQVDPEGGPLFLFVNIADAHGPWRAVPETLGWIPAQRGLLIDLTRKRSTYRRLVRGNLDEDELATARQRYLNAYDYGVYRADHTLGLLLRALEQEGWLEGRYRIVVTSDHGEYLAERGLVGHGGYLLEANNRIPLLYVDSAGQEVALPDPLSGLAAFYLARDGHLSEAPPTLAVAFPNLRMRRVFEDQIEGYDQTSVGLWEGNEKWLWVDGKLERYDLLADPDERSPELLDPELAPEPLLRALRELADLSSQPSATHEGLLERLRALGYVD